MARIEIFFILIIFAFVAVQSQSELQTRFFNLPVDHFSTTDRRNFNLRYVVNEHFYRDDGPVFILINDGPARTQFITEGNMFELAEREGAVLVSLEQRYFGTSRPTSDASFENLQWLTVHQVVADIGRFANFMKRQYFDAPVILWGYMRGGTLATWARQQYPNVIDGAWGSSAFINAVVEDVDFFPNTIRTISQIGGDECGQVIADAFRMIEESVEAGNTSYIEQRLITCGPIDIGNEYDVARFVYTIAHDIGSNSLAAATYPQIDEKCSIMRGLNTPGNPPADPIDGFARWYIDEFHSNIGTECIPVSNEDHVSLYQGESWDSQSTTTSVRQWLWLSCTQYGQWHTANNGQGHPFGTRFDLRFFRQWCADAFGDNIFLDPFWMDDTIRGVNRFYGGLSPGAYRLFLTQGEMDPHRSLGPAYDLNPLSHVVVMPLQSFGRDMNSPDESGDYVVLYQTKLRIQRTIQEWIEYARFGEPTPPPPPGPPDFVTRWFNLPLDHFNVADRRSFDLRYFVNENVYRENGPIFIYITDGPADARFLLEGNMFEVAQREGGVLISLEHRYFGRSLPTPDASFENLQFLSIHQVIADIGRFSNFMKRQYFDAPIILWGRGRAGALAVWARQKYPNVIDGAWGSSAVTNTIPEDVDFLPNIFRTFNQIGGDECGLVFTDAFRIMDESFESGNTSFIEDRFMTCEPFDVGNGYDLAMFNYLMVVDIGNYIFNASYPQIDEVCSIMRGLNTPENLPADALDGFARWYIDVLHLNRGTECIRNNYQAQIDRYQGTSWTDISTRTFLRQGFWMHCTQFGQFKVSNHGQGHPFGTWLDMRFFKQYCADAFQDNIFLDPWWMDDTIRDVNRIFGGLNPGAYRVFITQGELDPYRSLGPANDLNPLSPVVVIPLQSFSRDVFAPDESGDYVALYNTKIRIQQTIHEWIEYARYGEPALPPPPPPPEFVTRWFNLPVDHFSTTDRRTWDIRYLVNENLYRENGPIFIFINEGEASSQFIIGGNMFEVAQREGGVLISLESRFFGRSFPTSDASFENLQWLSIHQAVADIGRFANFMKRQYFDAPIILWGRSRGGALAVWARQKYPNVIDGAWGSSARLNAIVEDVDFMPNTFRTITQIGGDECGQVLTDAFRMIEESFESGNTSYVEQRLMTCDNFDVGNGYDLAFFTFFVSIDIGYFVSFARYPQIDNICTIMRGLDTPDNPPSDPLDGFARWYIDDYHQTRGTECIRNNYQNYITRYQGINWNDDSITTSIRQMLWYSCTQFGQFQVANYGQGHPFGSRFDTRFFRQYCTDAFGDNIFMDPWWMDDTIRDVNRIFGGLNPGAYRIFLTQGEMDPFRSLGPAHDLNPLSPVAIIPLQSFSRDVFAPDESGDYVALYNTKIRIQQTVHEWIEYARYGEPVPPPPPSPPEFVTRWFNLPVDHFSTTNRRTWDIRYLVNDYHYRENGPIFIYIGGRNEIYPDFITRGNIFDTARAQGGVLIALEHRFFGRSRPTNDTSFENLQFLTVHQAIADIGRFANFMKRQYFDAPIILWGRNYGGSLAVWARQKYPNVIDGAYASSAPLNAIPEDTDFFVNTFRTITQIGGPECGQILTDAFRMIEEAFEAGDTSQIEQRLNTCAPIDIGNGYDLTRMIYWIANDIGENFVSNARYPEIDEKCIIMRGLNTPDNPPSDPLDAFARWYIDDFHLVRGTSCVPVNNEEFVREYQDSDWNADSNRHGLRQSLWLSCAQLGQFQVANNGQGHPFGNRFDLRFFRTWCADAFENDVFMDPWFLEDTTRGVNRIFGGLNPGTYRTFFTHGEMDPLRSLGPYFDINPLSPVVVMSLQSHSRDMGSIEDTDYVVLHQTKLRIQQEIYDWIDYARYGEIPPLPTE